MIYDTELIVNVPIHEFIAKMDNVENRIYWQTGLVSTEHISGIPGQLGSKMKMNFQFGKRKMTLLETITKRNLPDELHATYVTKSMINSQENYFTRTSNGFTNWVSKNEFSPLKLNMQLMILFMPFLFRKQTFTYMRDFKNFAENNPISSDV